MELEDEPKYERSPKEVFFFWCCVRDNLVLLCIVNDALAAYNRFLVCENMVHWSVEYTTLRGGRCVKFQHVL